MLRREQHIFHHQPVLVLLYIYIYLTSPCHGRQSILSPCNMGFQTLLMIAHLLHLIFIASPKNVGPSWVAFPRSRTRAQTSMILSSWSTQFAISMNTTSGEDTLVSFNYHKRTEPAYIYIYTYTYTFVCSKPLNFPKSMKQLQGVRNSVAWKLRAAAVCEEELVRKLIHRWGVEASGSEQRVIQWWTGWWFQRFIFHNIWDSPSHWLICFNVVKATNQWKWWWFDVWLFGDSSNNLYRDFFDDLW